MSLAYEFCAYDEMVLSFFDRAGKTGYRRDINRLCATYEIMTNEADRRLCTAEIDRIMGEAIDRYEDYKTDPFP